MKKKAKSKNGLKSNNSISNSVKMELVVNKQGLNGSDRIETKAIDDDEDMPDEKEDDPLRPNSNRIYRGWSKENGKCSTIILKRETDLSIDQTGLQRFLPQCLQFAFADRDAEQMYKEYYRNEKRTDFKTLITLMIIVNCSLLFLYSINYSESNMSQLLVVIFTLCIGIFNYLWITLRSSFIIPRLWTFIPFIVWIIFLVHLFCDLWLYPAPRLPNESLALLLLYTYTIYVIFPTRLQICCILSLLLAIIYFAYELFTRADDTAFSQNFFFNLFGANVIIVLGTNLLGIMSYFFYERQQRRAFLKTCQSLEVKLVLEEESQEQERLLLSVLPKHVAAEIRQDLGSMVTGQFKKIYMSRHENVSILFADIVGFTVISSICSAAELVKILNELFARFDKLSEKYHQLRIKILGDCYYCISGAPEERSDHAVLCVHMGLSMVEAIKSIREETKSGVDMRVGVHTGGVLAGVLGQRQWQFDVYSRDVDLANKMESGGLPGRVHISEKTLSFLNGEFEVCNGDGASREEAIRLANIQTYFIVKVLKPYPEGTLDAIQRPSLDSSNDAQDTRESIIGSGGEIKNIEEYNRRLKDDMLNRDNCHALASHSFPFTLSFKDRNYERQFKNFRDIAGPISLVSLPLTLIFSLLAYLLVGSNQLITYSILVLNSLILIVSCFVCMSSIICKSVPKPLLSFSKAVQAKSWIRLVTATSMIIVWISAHVVVNIFCGQESSGHLRINQSDINSTMPNHEFFEDNCIPHYLSYFCILGMLAITTLQRITYCVKMLLILLLLIIQCVFNLFQLAPAFHLIDHHLYSKEEPVFGHEISVSIKVLLVSIALYFVNRNFETMARRLFLWQKKVEEQKKQVEDMRQKNEALVYNILPPHVALHFLGRCKKDEELYSKSYESVGVLFAAMPNFSDFYTEESVNNQGLECLRFLNEVISDFDALLEQPRFKDIYKIKTISSTYMAASGLNETGENKGWAHLATLTDFALTLKETLNNINKESFNNFVLRMGINHGPITAGVIGARKPHYDMWGNTVNVASRMESTGKAGCIQVVQETAQILEEFGFIFEQRGLVSIKGKGKLMTYYLIGKKSSI